MYKYINKQINKYIYTVYIYLYMICMLHLDLGFGLLKHSLVSCARCHEGNPRLLHLSAK